MVFKHKGGDTLFIDDLKLIVTYNAATYTTPFKDVTSAKEWKVGDKITAEYRIWNEENRSFVKLSAFRPASLRPVDQLSGAYYGNFYNSYRNVLTNCTEYWSESWPEETTTVKEELFVTQSGAFQSPAIEIESLYAPHYRANSTPFALYPSPVR